MAEQSGEAAKQISTLVSAIQSDTSNVVQAMELGTRKVKTGSELLDNVGVAFGEIASSSRHWPNVLKICRLSYKNL